MTPAKATRDVAEGLAARRYGAYIRGVQWTTGGKNMLAFPAPSPIRQKCDPTAM